MPLSQLCKKNIWSVHLAKVGVHAAISLLLARLKLLELAFILSLQ